MAQTDSDRIELHRHGQRVTVRIGTETIADTRDAIELSETGYPSRQYLPCEAIVSGRLSVSNTRTHCPFKGDARYYDLIMDGKTYHDAAWSYPEPLEDMADIAGRVVFDDRLFEYRIGN